MPPTSQCQISIFAPASGTQEPLSLTRLILRLSRMPGRTEPSLGSVRISERFRFSSTQYGPSVCAPARLTQVAASASTSLSLPVTASTPAPPSSASVRRRLSRTLRSEIAFVFVFIQVPFYLARRFDSACDVVLDL